jgi:hypothetical protein
MVKLNRIQGDNISTCLYLFICLCFSQRNTKLIVPLSVPRTAVECK